MPSNCGDMAVSTIRSRGATSRPKSRSISSVSQMSGKVRRSYSSSLFGEVSTEKLYMSEISKGVSMTSKSTRIEDRSLLSNQSNEEPIFKSDQVTKLSMVREDQWKNGPTCLLCREKFSMIKRKHHCRVCGNVICDSCGKMLSREAIGEIIGCEPEELTVEVVGSNPNSPTTSPKMNKKNGLLLDLSDEKTPKVSKGVRICHECIREFQDHKLAVYFAFLFKEKDCIIAELQKETRDNDQTLEYLNQKVRELIKVEEQRRAELQSREDELNSQLRHAHKMIRTLELKNEQYTDETTNAYESLSNMEINIGDLTREIESREERNDALRRSIHVREEVLGELDHKLTEKRRRLKSLQNNITQSHQQKNEATNPYDDHSQLISVPSPSSPSGGDSKKKQRRPRGESGQKCQACAVF